MCKKLSITIDDDEDQKNYGGEYYYIGSFETNGEVTPYYKQVKFDPSVGKPMYLYHNEIQLIGVVSSKAIYRKF